MNTCPCCKNEPEPGYIELPNNGAVVPCWTCNFDQWRRHGGRYSAVPRPRSIVQEQYEAARRVKQSLRR